MLKLQKRKPIYEYTPIIEEGEENPFTVGFRLLTQEELAMFNDEKVLYLADGTMQINSDKHTLKVLESCLMAWQNLEIDGEVIPYGDVSILPWDLKREIATHIEGLSEAL